MKFSPQGFAIALVLMASVSAQAGSKKLTSVCTPVKPSALKLTVRVFQDSQGKQAEIGFVENSDCCGVIDRGRSEETESQVAGATKTFEFAGTHTSATALWEGYLNEFSGHLVVNYANHEGGSFLHLVREEGPSEIAEATYDVEMACSNPNP